MHENNWDMHKNSKKNQTINSEPELHRFFLYFQSKQMGKQSLQNITQQSKTCPRRPQKSDYALSGLEWRSVLPKKFKNSVRVRTKIPLLISNIFTYGKKATYIYFEINIIKNPRLPFGVTK